MMDISINAVGASDFSRGTRGHNNVIYARLPKKKKKKEKKYTLLINEGDLSEGTKTRRNMVTGVRTLWDRRYPMIFRTKRLFTGLVLGISDRITPATIIAE